MLREGQVHDHDERLDSEVDVACWRALVDLLLPDEVSSCLRTMRSAEEAASRQQSTKTWSRRTSPMLVSLDVAELRAPQGGCRSGEGRLDL